MLYIAFLYVAEEKGYFEDEGIELDIQFPANPTDPINLAAAGKVTMGITYQPDVIIAKSEQDIGDKICRCTRPFAIESCSIFKRKWHRVTKRFGRKNGWLLQESL